MHTYKNKDISQQEVGFAKKNLFIILKPLYKKIQGGIKKSQDGYTVLKSQVCKI